MGVATNKDRKRRQRAAHRAEGVGKPSSETAGYKKGIFASPTQRSMCRRNRSWKRGDYAKVMATLGKRKGGVSS